MVNILAEKQEKIIFINQGKILTFKSPNEDVMKIEIRQFPLTEVGKELATLVPSTLSDERFMEFAKIIKHENTNIEVQVHKIVDIDDDNIEYESDDLL